MYYRGSVVCRLGRPLTIITLSVVWPSLLLGCTDSALLVLFAPLFSICKILLLLNNVPHMVYRRWYQR